MRALRLVAALVAFASTTVPAHPAIVAAPTLSSPSSEAPSESAPAGIIDPAADSADDARIAARANAIFAEIPALRSVRVRVTAGVVTLTGAVAEAEAIDRAEAIAGRLAGVVTVQNRIERDLQVGANLDPAVGGLAGKVREVTRAAPLIGVALLIALVIGAFGYLLAGQKPLWRRIVRNPFLAELIASAIRFAFVVLGIVVALEIVGAGAMLSVVLGGAGVLGVALGFAIRDTIDNYISSLMLSLRQPFRANDHVVIDGSEGRVVRLTSRPTVLMTLDGNHLRIPNSTVFKSVILNYTRNPQRRFAFVLGIDAEDDPLAAMQVASAALAGLESVLDDPEPGGWIVQVGDSNIELNFVGWIDQRRADFNKVRSQAIAAVKAALEAGGFALPEPIYRLRFDPAASLPMQASAGEPAPQATPRHDPQPRKIDPKECDVLPEEHVKRLVEEERDADSAAGEDLLDPCRPVE